MTLFTDNPFEKMMIQKPNGRQMCIRDRSTIGSYYTSLVSHDMYGGRIIQSARSKGIPDYTCNEDESL